MALTTRLVLAALICLAASAPDASAQDSRPWTIRVDHFESGPDDPATRVTQDVRAALENEFNLLGIETGESAMSRLLLSAQPIATPDGDHIMVAIVESSGLSDSILDAAAENELWYADKPRPENLEEGRFVRQYMTREVFEDLRQVHGVRLLYFHVDDLQMEISRYVADYRDRVSCDDPRDCSGGDGE